MDDRWYMSGGLIPDETGIALGPETIFRCGTVLAAVRFLADATAMCPPNVIERRGERRIPRPEHYAERVLRNPNAWQTGYRWRHARMVWVATYGKACYRIVGGARSPFEELRPIHPAAIKVLRQAPDGTLIYEERLTDGRTQLLDQGEVLHFRGISFDGIEGAPMYALIRNVVQIALLAERHQGQFLKKGSRLAGLLLPKHPIKPEQSQQLKESFQASFGGAENTGTAAVLPFEVDFKPMAATNRDSQLVELSDSHVGAILRFLGVPGVVVGWMGDKTSTYASAEAFFEKGGIKHSVMPYVTNFEDEEEKALLPAGSLLQIKHNLDVLLRANTKDRYDALFKASGRPWMTPNEVRAIEDMNPDPDPESDKIGRPANMEGALPCEPPPPEPEPGPRPPRPAPAEDSRAERYANLLAGRVVRRELAALRDTRTRAKFARDPEGWRAWLATYYDKHAEYVVEALTLDDNLARGYAASQRDAVLAGGVKATEDWIETVVPRLAAMMLEA